MDNTSQLNFHQNPFFQFKPHINVKWGFLWAQTLFCS